MGPDRHGRSEDPGRSRLGTAWHHILRDVSLEVAPGKVTAVLGRNGVGKTTLLRSIMGVVPVAAGKLSFEGRTSPARPRTGACAPGSGTCRKVARSSRASP